MCMNLPALKTPPPDERESPAAARPKIMRRPAHFSGPPTQDTPTPPPTTPAKAASAPITVGMRPWQEDGRFGLALVVILLMVNLGLMLWLPRLQPRATPVDSVAMPVIIGSKSDALPSAVTLYSQPSARSQAIHVLGAEPSLTDSPEARIH